MFETRQTFRLHPWLIVPAALVLLGTMARNPDMLPYALMIVPPFAAVPLLVHATLRRTPRALQRALTGTRVLAYAMLPWSLLLGLAAPLLGALEIGVAVTFLAAAGARRNDDARDAEVRLGFVTLVTGASIAAAMIILVWFRLPLTALGVAAGGLLAGGVSWIFEARRVLREDTTLPRAYAVG